MASTAFNVGDRALDPTHEPLRDEIVLSHSELFDAHRIAAQQPGRAMTYLAECERDGYEVNPRTREKYREAAKFVIRCGLLPVYDTEKPEPVVTARTTTRVLPSIQTDEVGNRFLEARDGSYRFTFIESPDDDEPAAEFSPRVIADADPEMDDDVFAVYAEDAARFARAIKTPVASSWNAAVAS